MKSLFIFILMFAFAFSASAHIDTVEAQVAQRAQKSTTSDSGVGTSGTVTTKPEKASVDFFIKIDGVDGESEEKKKGKVETKWKIEEGEKANEEDPDRGVSARQGLGTTTTDSDDAEDGDAIDTTNEDRARGGVRIAIGDVNGLSEEEKRELLLNVKAHAEVKSEQDLENFAKGVLIEDENIKEVLFESEMVTVKYRSSGKLFGFIPLRYTQTVEVSADADTEDGDTEENDKEGRVRVRMPWFSFLVSEDVSKEEIEESSSEHRAMFQLQKANGELGWQAQSFITISNILKARHDVAKNAISNVR